MLINKMLLEQGLMIVRSTNTKFLKYLMDLSITPIVVVMPSNGSPRIVKLKYGITTTPIAFIRPLTVPEIKKFLHDSKPLLVHELFSLMCAGTYIFSLYRYTGNIFINRNDL